MRGIPIVLQNVADFGEDRGIGRVFKQAITFVAKVKEAKCRVLIHCFAGSYSDDRPCRSRRTSTLCLH